MGRHVADTIANLRRHTVLTITADQGIESYSSLVPFAFTVE